MSELLDKQLFWERYRPATLEEVIIPDRIRKLVEKGIQANYLFHGHSGVGKTTLVRILLQEYKHRCLILDGKLGVDDLRNKVDTFCKSMIAFETDQTKIVYFEEFDRATNAMQEELKSFMEDPIYSKYVKFIATCNNISKLKNPVRSRFMEVDFTPIGDESKELKKEFMKRVIFVCEREKFDIPSNVIKDIIVKRFPDFRKVWQDIQQYHLTGTNSSIAIENDDEDTKLFELILSKKSSVDVWEYLYVNWMDKIDLAFQKLGREFFEYIKQNQPQKVLKMGNVIIVLSDYTDLKLPNALDPFVTLTALVIKMQEILN